MPKTKVQYRTQGGRPFPNDQSGIWGRPVGSQLYVDFCIPFFQPLGQPDRAQIGRFDLPSGGQSLCSHRMDLLLYRSGDVSYHERRSSHPVFRSFGPWKLDTAACLLGWNRAEKLPHGSALESLCRLSHHPAAVSPHIHAASGKRLTAPPQAPAAKREGLILIESDPPAAFRMQAFLF